MAVSTTERLSRSPDVRRALRRGTRRGGRHVVVHLIDRRDDGPTRIAVVATRRVGNAVERNRAKRVLREAVRGVALPVGHDVAVVARRPAAEVRMQIIRSEIEQMFG